MATGNITRVCTDNCGLTFNETKPCVDYCTDNDHDNYCACQGQALSCDCDDNNSAVHPDASELCNNRDDNCDATIDEGCPCTQGDNRTCGVNTGLCREGIQRCVASYWSICGGPGYIGPRPEICNNGLDENCNGYSDDGCICQENQTQECGTDTGECQMGVQTCFVTGNWSACSGSKDPLTEVCSGGKDEDCDGTIDCNDTSCSSSCGGGGGGGGQTPNCFDAIKNQGETNVDCGGPCPSCEAMCGFGSITQACACESVTRTSGYCCDGKYKVSSCDEACIDSDSDTLCDADEIRDGTDPNNADTDGDGVPDNQDTDPLCNVDGKCDSTREYPETPENCPKDCAPGGGEGLGLLWWIIIILLVLIVGSLVFYLLVKQGVIKLGKRKREEPKVLLNKPLFKPTIQPVSQKKVRDTSKLVDYLDKALKKGDSRLKLRDSALKAGWTNDEINRAFESLDKNKKQGDKKFFSILKK
jgi:hypothetical protein